MEGIKEYFKEAIREVRKFHPDWYIEEVGVEKDHVHIHMIIPPKYSVSRVIECIKSIISRRIRKKFPNVVRKTYWDGGGIWARGFFVSTVGITENIIKKYVRMQGQQDSGQAKLEL